MRNLEIFFLLSLLLASYLYLYWRESKIKRVAFFVSLTLLILHFLLDKPRWQLFPAYALAGLFVLSLLHDSAFSFRHVGKSKQGWVAIFATALISISTLMALLFPVEASIPTTGPYMVGQRQYHWIDEARLEIYGGQQPSPRELMITIWYPSMDRPDGSPSKWMDGISLFSDAMAEWLGLPAFVLSHLDLIESNSYANAEMAATNSQFPVLVFSHGWSGFREQNSFQTEELASHGYVVVGINHSYGAMATIFPNERIVFQDSRALPNDVSLEEYGIAAQRLGSQWANDIRFVYDQLERLANNEIESPFAGRLDTSRMGVFGHSTGAGADISFCSNDIRCKAMLLMDPWMAPVSAFEEIANSDFPVLTMFSENWDTLSDPSQNYARYDEMMSEIAPNNLMLTISGTKHADFTVLPLLSPLTSIIGLKGPIENVRGLTIINSLSLDFFESALMVQNVQPQSNSFDDFQEVLWGTHP